jgi:hypothetical protein
VVLSQHGSRVDLHRYSPFGLAATPPLADH